MARLRPFLALALAALFAIPVQPQDTGVVAAA